MSKRKMTRRTFLGLAGMGVATGLAACAAPTGRPSVPAVSGGPATPAVPTPTTAPQANVLGKVLPPDAAPLDKQVMVVFGGTPYTLDRFISMYQSSGLTSPYSLGLVRFNKNYDLLPAAAESWSPAEDGKKWIFKLRRGIKWSDGNELTAHDYVATFQLGASPEHAWDFAWYYLNLKNWGEATAGKVPVSEIGVKALDDYTLEFEATSPAPYLPSQLIWSVPLSKAALEKHGKFYNNDVATSVTCSPLKLTEWSKDKRFVLELNEKYTGPAEMIPWYTKFVSEVPAAIDAVTAFQSSDVLWMRTDATTGRVAEADPSLADQVYWMYGDFRTYFVGFNFAMKPFDDIRVRQALSMCFDRAPIVQAVAGRGGVPAYTFLAAGFPGSWENSPEAKTIQPFDVEKAKQLLAEAGYPNGQGFPKLEIPVTPIGGQTASLIAQGFAAEVKNQLGIEAEVVNRDWRVFIEEVRTNRAAAVWVDSYGMDYLDQSNMLGVFTSNRLTNWNNETYDAMFNEAAAYAGPKEERDAKFYEAEKMVLSQFVICPLYHERIPYLIKPQVTGPGMEPDKIGVRGSHWPDDYGLGEFWFTTYIKNM
ncbi:MAG: ABC transporter substrate-binding protein [Candidatus Roseilinea sp.]|nr:MAG: ABC transporter substrate-binding protein [Candidatus Roseilinea sp.]